MSDQIPLPTVDLFTSELESVGPKWYDFGIFLGISTQELDVIGKYHGSEGTQRCLIELFKCFQYRTKPVSWNDIVDALTKIHNNYIADRIRDKYIQTVSSSCPLSPPYTEKQVRTDSQVMGTDSASKTHDDKHIYELKTRDFWGPVALNKFERLAKLIFQNIYDCAAQIRIEDGCICVSWVIPDIDTSVLDTVSPDLLKVVGVISLKIDDKVLYEGPNEGCHILESAFLQAVELGNVRAVELLLAVGCDTNIQVS